MSAALMPATGAATVCTSIRGKSEAVARRDSLSGKGREQGQARATHAKTFTAIQVVEAPPKGAIRHERHHGDRVAAIEALQSVRVIDVRADAHESRERTLKFRAW